MRYLPLYLLLFLAGTAFSTYSQNKVLPPEARSFVKKGFEVLDYVIGDLNGDKHEDAILILNMIGEDTAFDTDQIRPLLILLRQPNGKLKLEKQNDHMVMCRQCGGVFGDPYESTTIENGGFTLSFYGGSNWRWSYQYVFNYEAASKNWALRKETQTSYWTINPDSTMKETVINAEELKGINFDNFNNDTGRDESKWKVTAAKTFFYDSPGLKNKPRKGYLLKNDIVDGLRVLTNFVEVSFQNKKEQFTTGYVLKKDLVKIK